ncbi:unnamed protein product [Rotaria sp. Silwood2]|nr:unnamed protein product [Rotaria sp. Silwood2]CAF4366777.1 unnamed protein product [Rotaria sp. Silwood2]
MTCSGAFPLMASNSGEFVFNQPRVHQAVMPAANGISNAHSLARIYALLIGDVNENGNTAACLLSKKTLQLATENVTPPDEHDQALFGLMTKFSRGGFELYGDFFNVLGEDGFGHKDVRCIFSLLNSKNSAIPFFLLLGMGGSLAFASSSRQLAFAYVFNQLDFSTLTTDPRNLQIFKIIDTIIKEKTVS